MLSKTNSFEKNENLLFSFIKGLIVAMLISFALVILFAFLLKWLSISDQFIFVGTMIIKALSAGFGSFVAVGGESKGLLKGALFGIIYIFCAFLVFSFLSGSFDFDKQTLLDFVSCLLIGGIIGVVKINK